MSEGLGHFISLIINNFGKKDCLSVRFEKRVTDILFKNNYNLIRNR